MSHTPPTEWLPDVTLRPGERVVLWDRESRIVRGLADSLVCVLAMVIGVGFHAFAYGGADTGGVQVLITIAISLAPVFLFLSTRPLSAVLVTNQRVFVEPKPAVLESIERHHIDRTWIWLATLFIRTRNGATLSVGNIRTLYALRAELSQGRPR